MKLRPVCAFVRAVSLVLRRPDRKLKLGPAANSKTEFSGSKLDGLLPKQAFNSQCNYIAEFCRTLNKMSPCHYASIIG